METGQCSVIGCLCWEKQDLRSIRWKKIDLKHSEECGPLHSRQLSWEHLFVRCCGYLNLLWVQGLIGQVSLDWKFTEKPHQAQEVLELNLVGHLEVLDRKRSVPFVSSFPLVSDFLVAVGSQGHCLAASQPQQGLSACACPPCPRNGGGEATQPLGQSWEISYW